METFTLEMERGREEKKKEKTVYGSLLGSKLSYFNSWMLQMIIDDTHQAWGPPILLGTKTHSGMDGVRAVRVRGAGLWARDERASPTVT